RLRQSVARFLEMEEIQVDMYKSFLEMGSDSLVLIAAIQEIQEVFGIKLTVRQLFTELTNIHLLATYIDANMPAHAAFLGICHQTHKPAQKLALPAQPQVLPVQAAQGLPISDTQGTVMERIIAQQLASMNQLMQQQLQTAAGFQSTETNRSLAVGP